MTRRLLAAFMLCLALAACSHGHGSIRNALIVPILRIQIAGGHGDPLQRGMPPR